MRGWLPALSLLISPTLLKTFCSAFSRMEHVFRITTSAASAESVTSKPPARSLAKARSVSATFIWQPKVSMCTLALPTTMPLDPSVSELVLTRQKVTENPTKRADKQGNYNSARPALGHPCLIFNRMLNKQEFNVPLSQACLGIHDNHSHSIVLGGFELTSKTTRFIPLTSDVSRVEIRPKTSCGSRAQSAVIPSTLVTARIASTLS